MKFKVRGRARKALRAWPLIGVIVVTVVCCAVLPFLTKTAADIGIKKHPKIKDIIYPTFGNPAFVKKGTGLTIEFDPHEKMFGVIREEKDSLKVSISTSNGPFPVTRKLEVVAAETGPSGHWPKDELREEKVFLVTVIVPVDIPADLYDLKVSALEQEKKGEVLLEDSQPHALQTVDAFKDKFSFCQLTDIHLYGPECGSPSAYYSERSGRPNGKDPNRKGGVYYQKAISQLNVMKPDFCIYTGDYMFGQFYFAQDQGSPWGVTTEYEYEMLWFYEETLKLDVPVFMTIGNHDSFAEGDQGGSEDWFENWRKLFGPLYFSFDYGGYHFQLLNTQDWPVGERTLIDYQFAMQPAKYKGQIRGKGDSWRPGVTEKRIKSMDESKFKGQLAWMRDDLKSHMGSKMRVCATHQEPWMNNGSGLMWASGEFSGGVINMFRYGLGFAGVYGNGKGRLAAVKLMRQYNVALMITGHFHSDYVSSLAWKDGKGQTIYANTTCTQLPKGGPSSAYPGYRWIWVDNGAVTGVNYKEPKWSYPWYRGTNVGGETNIDTLKTPAIVSAFNQKPGASQDVTFTVDNALAKPIPAAFAKFYMPYLSGGYYYRAQNGAFGAVYDDKESSPEVRICQVYTDVGAGTAKSVRVGRSDAPDTVPPAGKLGINGGSPITRSREVTLSISAGDAGGSGVQDMMISSSPDFKGASWQTYRSTVTWKLAVPAGGNYTVYIKFRDGAMPPNQSAVSQATILYYP